jgi:ferredoxin-NADP reductase/Na+-transporting NADH:ubiquinone oxidoreductase subunit NqrB
MNPIDSYLSTITSYRLTLGVLGGLAVLSILGAFMGWVGYSSAQLVVSLVILVYICAVTNRVCVLLNHASATRESSLTTALILFFIASPPQSAPDALLLIVLAVVAILSKYVIAYHARHLFNPAAIGLFLLAGFTPALINWWVVNPFLLPFVVVGGLLVVRKVRKMELFFIFGLSALFVTVAVALWAGAVPAPAAIQFLLATPLLFIGFFMITDPHTIPGTRSQQRVYASIVGTLFALFLSFHTPAYALLVPLLIGNAYSFLFAFQGRRNVAFHSVKKLSRTLNEYTFSPNVSLRFTPGQHAEWSAPHAKADQRGIRRRFVITSSPQDVFMRIATSLPTESSTFKDVFKALTKGDVLSVAHVAGDFTLPKDPRKKIALIADGIGIAPFISMFRSLADTRERRDIILVYAATSPLDFAYKDEIDSIKDRIGLSVLYIPADFTEVVGWEGHSGLVTSGFIEREVLEYSSRLWYVAAPDALVRQYVRFLRGLGISRRALRSERLGE